MKNTFPKNRRLCGQQRIKGLYTEGTKMVVWPLRVTYMYNATEGENKVLIWAPKSLFKHAVDRNRLRRQMRESYRLNQSILPRKGMYIAFNYIDKQMQPYHIIDKAMQKALNKLAENTVTENGHATD